MPKSKTHLKRRRIVFKKTNILNRERSIPKITTPERAETRGASASPLSSSYVHARPNPKHRMQPRLTLKEQGLK